jgi:hypothetical protein
MDLQREVVRPIPSCQLIYRELFAIRRNANVQPCSNVQRLESSFVETWKAALNMESKGHQLIVVERRLIVPNVLACDTSSAVTIAQILEFADFGLAEIPALLLRPPCTNGMYNVWYQRAVVTDLSRNEDAKLAKVDERRHILLMHPVVEAIRCCIILIDWEILANRYASLICCDYPDLLSAATVRALQNASRSFRKVAFMVLSA